MNARALWRALALTCAVLLVACGGQGPQMRSSTAKASPPPASSKASTAAGSPAGDWTQFDYNAQRSGVGPANTGINASNVGHLAVRVVHLDGTVDSSPIELHSIKVRGRVRDVVIVTTTYGRTIAIDPGTGAKLWEYVPAGIGRYEGTSQITNTTPIADPNRRYLYAASPDGRIRKLSVFTGHEVRSAHWPAAITFDAVHEKIGSALNISGRYVIAVTGGYVGDQPPYVGHVAMIDRSSGRLLHVFNALCSNQHRLIAAGTCPAGTTFGGAAIWARAGAVIEPGTHRILIATGNAGNAAFNGSTNWSDSVLELTPDATRLLHNWTPSNQRELNSNDADLGSVAPAIVPVTAGRRLAVQGGKAGVLDLLDLNRLNGTTGGAGPRLGGQIQELPGPDSGEMLWAPAVSTHAGHAYVFVANERATFAYVLTGGSHPRLQEAWHRVNAGTSPIVAGGLLYVYDMTSGKLEVRDPLSGNELASLNAANGHWNSPIAVGGRIVLPVGNANDHLRRGALYIYHVPGR